MDLVKADLDARREVGIATYGTALQPFNGRDALVDAYFESLDQAQYLRQRIEEEASGSGPKPDWTWLASTKWLQEEVYHYDDPAIAGVAWVCDYIDWNLTAAVQELAELRVEFHWKPWAKDAPYFNRDRIIAEAVDALHFVGNIMHAVQCSDEEFWKAYRDKQSTNVRRATSGNYSAVKGGLGDGSEL